MKKKTVLEGKETYRTGIPGIDAQHKELLALIDDFLKKAEKTLPPLSPFFESLAEQLKAHYATEEGLMEMIGFPTLELHRDFHQAFSTTVEEWQNNEASMGTAETLSVIEDFRAALLTHVKKHDADYTDFIDNLMAIRKKFKVTALTASTIAGDK